MKTKIYMPLSRSLKNHGMTSSHDCNGVIPQGAADSSIVATKDLTTRVVFEEKSESLFQFLLGSVGNTFPEMCRDGRSQFILGQQMNTSTARFQCPLILAQLLSYMAKEQTAYGVIMTSGRAHFVWVTCQGESAIGADEDAKEASTHDNKKFKQSPIIHVSEEIMVDDEYFLRILFNFILQAKDTDPSHGIKVATLLKTPTSAGGLTEGTAQHYVSPQGRSNNRESPTTSLPGRAPASNLASFALINKFSVIPDFKMTKTLTDTLGREKIGTVVATELYGVSAVVKAFARNETNGLEVQSHERYLFESEVEAYEIAGRAGLWGVAVPKPLFAAMDDNTCALCLTAGNPMPLSPEEWSCSDLRQALESVQHLVDAGIELSDIKPANFITMKGISSSYNGSVDTRVMAIDLEDSLPGEGESRHVEIPQWMLRGSSAQTVSP